MKPIIGVMPLWDDEKESIWMLPGYLDGIREAGGIPFIFPLTDETEELERLCAFCNGILFTGGHDVSPQIYREEPLGSVVGCCKVRDSMETMVLQIALRENKAILGVCRGIQFINASLGGTLYQDIPSQFSTTIDHHMTPPYDRVAHEVIIKSDTPLHFLLKKEKLGVNSYHHQAVKELAPGLVAMAEAEDGLVEAVYLPSRKYVWAFQWHPEFSHLIDEDSRKIFCSFIEASTEERNE